MAFRESVTIDQAIGLLNSAVAADPAAMRELLAARVPHNEGLADHPTIQCGMEGQIPGVGLLGIINGLFGVDERGWGAIAAVLETDHNSALVRFERATVRESPQPVICAKCINYRVLPGTFALTMEPRCAASRADFVSNGMFSLKECRKVNTGGECSLFTAIPLPAMRRSWWQRLKDFVWQINPL